MQPTARHIPLSRSLPTFNIESWPSSASSQRQPQHAESRRDIVEENHVAPLVPACPSDVHKSNNKHSNPSHNNNITLSQKLFKYPTITKFNNLNPKNSPVFSVTRLQQSVQTIIIIWACLTFVTLMHFRQLSNSDIDSNISQTSLTKLKPHLHNPIPFIPPLPSNHRIPLPLPSKKVSVVLMNHSRPRMIRESSLMRTLLAHPNVDEVVLLHSNPKTRFEFVHDKVVNIDATEENDEMGLSLRFYFCQLVTHDWVIHVDDDMEFSLSTLTDLLIEFNKNPKRLVGRFGRNLKPNSMFNGYSSKNTHLNSEVILTKFMIMERDMCSAFFEYAPIVWEDLVLKEGEGPLWNGEDIFMSLVANHVYGKVNNYAMDWLNVENAPEDLKEYKDGSLDISGGLSGYYLWDWHWWHSLLRRNRHYSYRGKLWTTAADRLARLKVMEELEEVEAGDADLRGKSGAIQNVNRVENSRDRLRAAASR